MQELVEKVPGATSAIFVDWEGEAVDQYSLEEDVYHLKVVGAYKGVMLNFINQAQASMDIGTAETVIVRMENYSVLISSVKDGYFVLLILSPGALISRARYGIRRAVSALRDEM